MGVVKTRELKKVEGTASDSKFFIACISRMFLIDEQDILFTFFFLPSPEIGYKPNFLDNIRR